MRKRGEIISHLKDQLQEMRGKTGMEYRYVTHACKTEVQYSHRKRCGYEKQLQVDTVCIIIYETDYISESNSIR